MFGGATPRARAESEGTIELRHLRDSTSVVPPGAKASEIATGRRGAGRPMRAHAESAASRARELGCRVGAAFRGGAGNFMETLR